ncbi:hypothetical protein BRADI_2g43846v3 [Brachypodium distachyon]|uniref:F-box domain-containing protein n=1 Tax=Brachypodium distachyon TaxID=15368 RepID=I1HPI2_BRADI|nr:hypothetical protein BRADI_2g43846v3 [Brachypodium distachyon]
MEGETVHRFTLVLWNRSRFLSVSVSLGNRLPSTNPSPFQSRICGRKRKPSQYICRGHLQESKPSDSEETSHPPAIRKAPRRQPPAFSGARLRGSSSRAEPIYNMVKIVGDDRLSTLPDDILVDILNRLDIRDAARSSVLSRRWQHLPAMLSRIKIDVFAFRPEDNPTFCLDEIVRINAVVAEATKSILARRDSSRKTISSLCMDFFLREDDSISIGNAVGRTMLTHKVDIAEFTVLTEKNDIGCDDDDLVRYGRQFRLFFDACPIAFGGLTHLRLMNLSLSELDISNVLITCKRLKKLRFLNCDSGNPTVLQVEHAHLCELAILDCSFERVELKSLPKLKRMTFDGWISYEDPLSIGYVPLLEALSLNNICLSWHKMVKLSRFLVGTSLRDLKLGFECEKIWVQPEHLTKRQASVFSQPTKFFVSR